MECCKTASSPSQYFNTSSLRSPARRLIVNADDFGRSHSINQAVLRAHRDGILTTASLMVNGAAAGAGMSLALACDIRIASDRAKFTTAFRNVGLSGDFGGSYFLTRLVGTARARELYFTAELLDAARALAIGLVNRVVPDAELETETLGLAGRLARGPRIAHR